MRRATVSIPSNIAEGVGRKGEKEWMRFLYISLGSLGELETQLEIAERLSFTKDNEAVFSKIFFIRKMIVQLIKKLNTLETL